MGSLEAGASQSLRVVSSFPACGRHCLSAVCITSKLKFVQYLGTLVVLPDSKSIELTELNKRPIRRVSHDNLSYGVLSNHYYCDGEIAQFV